MDVASQVTGGLNQIIEVVRSIANPIAVLAFILIGIYCIMGSDPQNIQKAKKWAIYIAIGLVCINLAKPIVDWLSAIGKQA